MNEKIKSALDSVLSRFQSGDVPEAITILMFPTIDVPMNKWSLFNRLIIFFAGSRDARGVKQWRDMGRHPRKGSKALYILAPRFVKKEDTEFLAGFLAVPVFPVERTDGKAIEYPDLTLPEFPLMEKAREWGIEVKGIEGNTRFYGLYSQRRNEISLATKDECTFFHELSHASHKRVIGELKGGQDWKQEIVAELSATVLCHLAGKEPDKTLGNSYQYIAHYAEKAKLSPHSACLKVLHDVEQVLGLILEPVKEYQRAE